VSRLNQVLVGDATECLRDLPKASVDTVITSPPYFRLRNYQVAGQLGMEATIDAWVANLGEVFGELARVLKPSGSVWLNVGDSFSRHWESGAEPKSLLLGPERLLVMLSAGGWLVRNRVAWVKPNPMPASVGDRLTCTWEPVYLLVRRRRYFFDLDAIRVPHRSPARFSAAAARRAEQPRTVPRWAGPLAGSQHGLDRMKASGHQGHLLGKNPGDVIVTASSNYRGAHFATFPAPLIEPLMKATCPERVCRRCGRPWERHPCERQLGGLATIGHLVPTCGCRDGALPGVVLDPFMGAGTVAVVAERLGRSWLGIELNPDFARLTQQRLTDERDRGSSGLTAA
jgi:site-specific DNA-methyltransferase (adenine-specific)